MIDAGVKENRTGTNGAFALLRNRDGQRVMFPVHQIGCRGMRPLMRTESPFAQTMVAVKEVKEMKAAGVEKRHAVAHVRVEPARRPELPKGTPWGEAHARALAPAPPRP